MPFCHELKKQEGEIDYAEIEACYNKLKVIDDYLVSKEIRVQLFGEKHADRYEYQPIVRAVQDLEDTESYFRPPYAKFKLELAYDDDTPAFNVFLIRRKGQNGGRADLLQGSLATHQVHDKAPHGHQLQ